MCRGRPPRSSLPNGRWAESFADDLNTRRGIVSGRVALLPRSTEIQPHVARIRPSPQLFYLERRFDLVFVGPGMPLKRAKCLRESTKSWRKHKQGKRNALGEHAMHSSFIQNYLNFSLNYQVIVGKHGSSTKSRGNSVISMASSYLCNLMVFTSEL